MDKAVQTNNCELNNNQYPEELLEEDEYSAYYGVRRCRNPLYNSTSTSSFEQQQTFYDEINSNEQRTLNNPNPLRFILNSGKTEDRDFHQAPRMCTNETYSSDVFDNSEGLYPPI